MFSSPLALLVSALAIFLDKSKGFGIAGLVISGLTCLYVLSLSLLPLLPIML